MTDRAVYRGKCDRMSLFGPGPLRSPGACLRTLGERVVVAVRVAVSTGKVRHPVRQNVVANARKLRETDILTFLGIPPIRMGFRGSRVRIPPSRLAEVGTPQQDSGRVSQNWFARPCVCVPIVAKTSTPLLHYRPPEHVCQLMTRRGTTDATT